MLAAGAKKDYLGFRSRCAKGHALYPVPANDARLFAKTVSDLVRAHDVPVVIQSVESTVIAVDEHREVFGQHVKLTLPHSVSYAALDKQAIYKACEELGIRTPKTCYPTSVQDGLEFPKEVGFPVVLKPRAPASVTAIAGNFDFKVRYALHRDDLTKQLESFAAGDAFPLLQEYCSGIRVAHSFLVANGSIQGSNKTIASVSPSLVI